MTTPKGEELLKKTRELIEELNDTSWFQDTQDEIDDAVQKIDQSKNQDKRSAKEATI